MPKAIKRLARRPGRYSQESGISTRDRDSGREKQAAKKSGNSIVDNKYVRLSALMFLPVMFGVLGLLMFPPSFDSSASSLVQDTNSNANEQILQSQKPNVRTSTTKGAGASDRVKKVKRDSTQQDQNGQKKQQNADKSQSGSSGTSSTKSRKKTENSHHAPLSNIQDFQPTFLQSLDIREVIVNGRNVNPVELTENKPESPIKVYTFEGFLTDEECNGLMRVHKQHVSEATSTDPIVCFDSISTLRKHLRGAGRDIAVSARDFTEGTSCVNASFSSRLKSFLTWSYSTSFYPGESKFSSTFQERVFRATGLKPSNGGKFQITSYPEKIGYKTHTDCSLNNPDKRDRLGTILVYLQDVPEGGETQFPELGISITPKKGRAVVWNNMNVNGDCEPLSIHTAAPVVTGHKYIIQRWYYYESFYQLGKRSREPDVPPRQPGQARVSCDEYEHGSCRWYDEWNYEHILDYRMQQASLH